MKLTDDFEVNNYEDYQKHKKEIFDIISEILDLAIEETARKNPTFLVNDFDKMVGIKDLAIGDKVYVIPIKDNKPLKVVLE